jgi:hypothetical protein
MNLDGDSTMKLPLSSWSRKVLAGVLGIAVLAGAWGAWMLRPRPDPGEAAPAAAAGSPEATGAPAERKATASPWPAPPKRRRNHPAIADLRKQMLQHLHGHAEAVFSVSDGFGLDRMPVVRAKLWEAPVFSPGDLETQGAVESPAPLREAFEESRARFGSPQPASKAEAGDTRGDGLQLRLLDLIGLRDRDNPRAYSGGPAFEWVRATSKEDIEAILRNNRAASKEEIDAALRNNPGLSIQVRKDEEGKARRRPETRPLDFFELAGLAELREGKATYVRHKDGVVRMLGALRASDQCLTCHAAARLGDLLGALSYTFVDTKRSLFKKAKKGPE